MEGPTLTLYDAVQLHLHQITMMLCSVEIRKLHNTQ